MAQVEKSLDLTAGADDAGEPVSASERAQLLELVRRLAEPQLSLEARLDLVEQMRRVLNHEPPELVEIPADGNGR